MTRQSWDDVGSAVRQFLDRGRAYLRQPEADGFLRERLSSAQPYAALMLLMTQSPQFRSEFLPEILEAVIRGPHQSLLLARDVFRSLPRAALEERVAAVLAGLLEAADDYEYSRAAEILVELRLREPLDVMRSMGRSHPDAEIREVIRSLDNVEKDPLRWGRLVQEWPIVEVEDE